MRHVIVLLGPDKSVNGLSDWIKIRFPDLLRTSDLQERNMIVIHADSETASGVLSEITKEAKLLDRHVKAVLVDSTTPEIESELKLMLDFDDDDINVVNSVKTHTEEFFQYMMTRIYKTIRSSVPREDILSLYFDLGDVSVDDVASIISDLSELYSVISGGDELEIVGSSTYEYVENLIPETV
jgi:hypothetical protein